MRVLPASKTSFPWASIALLLCCTASSSLRAQTASTLPASPSAQTAAGTTTQLAAITRLIDTGHAADALPKLDILAAQRPEPPGVERERGQAFYALSKWADANLAFAQAMQQDPNDTTAAQMRALALIRLQRPAEAIPLLESAHNAAAGSSVDPWYALALCYMDVRRYDDARHLFAAQYGFPPDSAASFLLAAQMLLRREYLPPAQDAAQHALALDPQLPLAHLLLGEIALGQNQLDVATAEFEKERIRSPLEGLVYERLGDVYSRAGRYADAQRVLQQAVLLEPYSTGPFILLGRALLRLHEPVGALTYLQRARNMDPSNFMTHYLLAQAYHELGRDDDAAAETKLTEKLQAASADPSSPK